MPGHIRRLVRAQLAIIAADDNSRKAWLILGTRRDVQSICAVAIVRATFRGFRVTFFTNRGGLAMMVWREDARGDVELLTKACHSGTNGGFWLPPTRALRRKLGELLGYLAPAFWPDGSAPYLHVTHFVKDGAGQATPLMSQFVPCAANIEPYTAALRRAVAEQSHTVAVAVKRRTKIRKPQWFPG